MTQQQRTAPGPLECGYFAQCDQDADHDGPHTAGMYPEWVVPTIEPAAFEHPAVAVKSAAGRFQAAEQSVPLDVEALRDPLTKWTHRWWCRLGPMGKRPSHRMPPCGEMVDDFLAEYVRLVPAWPAARSAQEDTVLLPDLDQVLRGMTDWIGLVEQPAYGGNSIYAEVVNEWVPAIKASALAAQPTSAEGEK